MFPALKLDEQSLDRVLDTLDLTLQLPGLVGSNTSSNDWPANATSSSEGRLRRNENIRHILVFTEQRQVKNNLNGLSVCCHDDELANTSVERLRNKRKRGVKGQLRTTQIERSDAVQ